MLSPRTMSSGFTRTDRSSMTVPPCPHLYDLAEREVAPQRSNCSNDARRAFGNVMSWLSWYDRKEVNTRARLNEFFLSSRA